MRILCLAVSHPNAIRCGTPGVGRSDFRSSCFDSRRRNVAFRSKKDAENQSGFMMGGLEVDIYKLNSGYKIPVIGIGTFMLTPDEAENSVTNALESGYRLLEKAVQEVFDICSLMIPTNRFTSSEGFFEYKIP